MRPSVRGYQKSPNSEAESTGHIPIALDISKATKVSLALQTFHGYSCPSTRYERTIATLLPCKPDPVQAKEVRR